MTRLSDNDIWLFQHMITAFWHTFGIANGLDIKKEAIEEVHYSKGSPRIAYRVKAETMREKLAAYLTWLEQYQESWGTDQYSCSEQDREEIFEPRWKERAAITKMIELLQI